MNLTKTVILLLNITIFTSFLDANYSETVKKLCDRRKSLTHQMSIVCGNYKELLDILFSIIDQKIDNEDLQELLEKSEEKFQLIADTIDSLRKDEQNLLNELTNLDNEEITNKNIKTDSKDNTNNSQQLENKKTVSSEQKFFNRSINTLENAEAIDNQYRELLERVFVFLCKATTDVNFIGDLLEEKVRVFKENTRKLEFIEKAQKKNLNAYLSLNKKSNKESDNLDNTLDSSEDHFFRPKEPVTLSPDYKKIEIIERISKKYIGEIPTQVKDIIFYFNNHKKCLESNIGIHNKLLLHGLPGTGKSHLVKVLAEELELPLCSFSGSFFGDKYIGESSRRIRKAFNVAKSYNKPILIFIDEIDALAIKRNNNMHIENRASLLTLLAELQELKENKNIFVFAATNDLKSLDSAILDRFAGAICKIKELDKNDRAQLFKKIFCDNNIEISSTLAERLAEVTQPSLLNNSKNPRKRFSNRDIEYIVCSALIKAFSDYEKNGRASKHLCTYIRSAIDETKKPGRFAWFFPTYCDGI